jgi:creatinine amidohydrolase
MMHLDPSLVRMDQLRQADDPDRTAGKVFTHVVPHTSTNGVTGHPSRATAADGRKLFMEIGEALTDVIRRAQVEQAPIPYH